MPFIAATLGSLIDCSRSASADKLEGGLCRAVSGARMFQRNFLLVLVGSFDDVAQ